MAKQLRDVMSGPPIVLSDAAPLVEAARQMRVRNVGAIVVEDGFKRPYGILTDRDITVRAVAEGRDPTMTQVADVCSTQLTTMSPGDSLDNAVQTMREKAIRRILVVDDHNRAVGMVSLGDLARERDARSVLAQISAAPPNQ